MPPYTIQVCTTSHATGISNANMRAFMEDAHWRLVWDPRLTIEELVRNNAFRLPKQLQVGRDVRRQEMAVDSETGEVVGYARWEFLNLDEKECEAMWPEGKVAETSREEMEEFERLWKLGVDASGRAIGVNSELTRAMGGEMHRETLRVTAGRPFIELDHLGTLPSHGRRGVGGLMLQSGIAQADALGLPIFIMAYPHGAGLYAKHGFELKGTVINDYSKFADIEKQVVRFYVKEPTPKS